MPHNTISIISLHSALFLRRQRQQNNVQNERISLKCNREREKERKKKTLENARARKIEKANRTEHNPHCTRIIEFQSVILFFLFIYFIILYFCFVSRLFFHRHSDSLSLSPSLFLSIVSYHIFAECRFAVAVVV